MSGVVWAAIAGVAFGVFQAVNRGTLVDMDVYESTFLQLLVSAVVLAVMLLGTRQLGRLATLPAGAWGYFALAGLVHFFAGWTLLNQSQKRIGAARTSPLLSTTPLFGSLLALLLLGEVPGWGAVLGMATIVVGVYVVELDRMRRSARAERAVRELRRAEARGVAADAAPGAPGGPRAGRAAGFLAASGFGLGAALAWSLSPIFIRRGLALADLPIVGVAVGILASTLAYGAALLVRRRPIAWRSYPVAAVGWKVVAGVLVGLATWTRWYALSLAEVAVVLSLGLLSVPTVIALAPVLAGRQLERVTTSVVVGSLLVMAGALVLIGPIG